MLVKIFNEKQSGYKYVDANEVSSYPSNLTMIKRKNKPSSVNNKHILVHYWRQKPNDYMDLNVVNDKNVSKDEDLKNNCLYYNEWLDIYYYKPNLSNNYQIYIDSKTTEKLFDKGKIRILKEIVTIKNKSEYKMYLLSRMNNCYILNKNGDTQQVI